MYWHGTVISVISPAARYLKKKVLLLLIEIYFLAFFLLFFGNVVIYQSRLQFLTSFWTFEMLGLGVGLFVIPGYFVSARLLRPLIQRLDDLRIGKYNSDSNASLAAARRAAFNYPWQAMVFFAGFGIVGSGTHHLISTLRDFGNLAGDPEWWRINLITWLHEFSLAVTLGIVYFTLVRRMLRPFLLALPSPSQRDTRRFSLRLRIIVTVLALAVTSAVPYLVSGLVSPYENRPVSGWDRAGMALEIFIINLGIGFALADDTTSNLSAVTKGISKLAGGGQVVSLHETLPVASDDEIGDLVLAFNSLQARAESLAKDLEQDMELARKIQTQLLPQMKPTIGGWQVDGVSLPAREVGGDFYDIQVLDNARLGITIGDVSGRGLPAALLMAVTLGFLRSEALRNASPKELMTRVNGMLCSTIPPGTFVSLIYMVVDTETWDCSLCSAGHVDPLVLGEGEAHQGYVPVASLPLGVDPEASYNVLTVRLSAGQKVLLYTDGIVEARNADGTFFGFESLRKAAQTLFAGKGMTGSRQVVTDLIRMAEKHAGTHGLDDDLTAVIVGTPGG